MRRQFLPLDRVTREAAVRPLVSKKSADLFTCHAIHDQIVATAHSASISAGRAARLLDPPIDLRLIPARLLYKPFISRDRGSRRPLSPPTCASSLERGIRVPTYPRRVNAAMDAPHVAWVQKLSAGVFAGTHHMNIEFCRREHSQRRTYNVEPDVLPNPAGNRGGQCSRRIHARSRERRLSEDEQSDECSYRNACEADPLGR